MIADSLSDLHTAALAKAKIRDKTATHTGEHYRDFRIALGDSCFFWEMASAQIGVVLLWPR